MNIEKLYRSGSFMLCDMSVTGKKATVSTLYFKGDVDSSTHVNVIRAVEEGVVTFAGRDYDTNHRASRLKTHVSILSKDSVTITYADLLKVVVKEGDRVEAGDPIGYMDNPTKLMLQCRRNGRFVDACKYFKIKREPTMFNVKYENDRDLVCERCSLTDAMRNHIDKYVNSDCLWERLARGIRNEDY